jgi:uncharacterized protein (TIRG00374 family)
MVPTSSSSAPPARRSPLWQILIGVAVSVLCLALALYQIDFRQLGSVFRRLQPAWVGLAVGLVLLAYFLRALLWRRLIGDRARPRLWNLFRIITLGYLANNLFPLKLGELLRAWLLGKREGLPLTLAVGTVVVERLLDLFALLFYFVLCMFLVPFAPWLKLSGLVLGSAGVVLAVLVLASRRYGAAFIERLERPLLAVPGGFGPWVHRQLGRFLEGLRLVQTWGQLARAYGWCLLTWLAWILVAFVCCQALGLRLPFLSAVFLIVVLNFGLMIPSSPGGLGVFEFMVILALAPSGVSKELALGVAFTFHMLQYLITLLIGWIFAVQFNLSMAQVYRRSSSGGDGDWSRPDGEG